MKTKKPEIDPYFELNKRTQSCQPAKASELNLGYCLCGFPYISSAPFYSRSGVLREALGANNSGLLLFFKSRTKPTTTPVVAAVGWIASLDDKTWLDNMVGLCMVID